MHITKVKSDAKAKGRPSCPSLFSVQLIHTGKRRTRGTQRCLASSTLNPRDWKYRQQPITGEFEDLTAKRSYRRDDPLEV